MTALQLVLPRICSFTSSSLCSLACSCSSASRSCSRRVASWARSSCSCEVSVVSVASAASFSASSCSCRSLPILRSSLISVFSSFVRVFLRLLNQRFRHDPPSPAAKHVRALPTDACGERLRPKTTTAPATAAVVNATLGETSGSPPALPSVEPPRAARPSMRAAGDAWSREQDHVLPAPRLHGTRQKKPKADVDMSVTPPAIMAARQTRGRGMVFP
mmetsp:Transcript_115558/g.338046  ORF Transcript_115558/g.338046 Transcript_115558/m.338046 type:complete len:217 (+) Transcript_115558:324-974(+)